MQLNNLTLIFLLFLFIIRKINSFKCSKKEVRNSGIIDVINKRRMDNEENQTNSSEFQNLIISYDYTTFDNYTDIDDTIKKNIKQLLEDISDIYKKLLQVKIQDNLMISIEGLNELIQSRCNINNTSIEEVHENITKNNQIVIFPYFDEFEDENILIDGEYCLITRDLYPKGGVLKINKNINFNKTNSKIYFKKKIFHEITHILLFEPNIMKGLKLVKNNKVISENVKEVSRHYFNCLSFLDKKNYGIPLEEDGYHWDSRYMLGDYMISFDYYDIVISDITLALFDDSGLYNVDHLYGNFNFGKNKTCSFFEKNCIEDNKLLFDDFCNINDEPKCSQSRQSKGYCYLEKNNNNINISKYEGLGDIQFCPISDEFKYNDTSEEENNYYFSTNCKYGINNELNYGEKFGNNSFCFISTLYNITENNSAKKAICYEVQCDSVNKIINVNVENNIITCPINGGNISSNITGLNGYLICPKYNDICFNYTNKTCNDMFDCINDEFKRDYIYDDNDFGSFLFYQYIYIILLFFIIL